eukprot:191416_1
MSTRRSKTDSDQNKNDPRELTSSSIPSPPTHRQIRWSRNRNARLKNKQKQGKTKGCQSPEDNTLTQKWHQGKVCKHVALRCNKHKRRQCALIHANVNTVQILCEWERKCGFCHNHRQCIFAMHSPIKTPSVANADPIVPMTEHPQSKEDKTLIQRWHRGKVCDHVAFRCNANRRRQCTLFHANVNSVHLPCKWEKKCGFCHNHQQCIFAIHKRARRSVSIF